MSGQWCEHGTTHRDHYRDDYQNYEWDDRYMDHEHEYHYGSFNRYGINHTPKCIDYNKNPEERCLTNHEYLNNMQLISFKQYLNDII